MLVKEASSNDDKAGTCPTQLHLWLGTGMEWLVTPTTLPLGLVGHQIPTLGHTHGEGILHAGCKLLTADFLT